MNILIKGATIIDPSSPFHNQSNDIFIQNGFIAAIGKDLDQRADEIIDIPGLHISAGWVDIFSHFNDPGYEFKETLETGSRAAAAGGYTDVFLLPNTAPCSDTKSNIKYLIQKGKDLQVTVHPIGAVTKSAEGKELAEMYDMHQSGAVSFSDGLNPIQSPGMMLKALQYIKAINKTLIQIPDDKSISGPGLINEGITSTQLGLPGKPALAEEILIGRDIELAKYTASKVHITGVSTANGIRLIKNAKENGVQVTCSVTPYHLFFCDEDLSGYDTNLKVNPPLRTKEDRTALQNAVLDGTVDCIATHHLPQDKDNKVLEFEYAKNGMIGLETSFAVVRTILPSLSNERIVELFCTNARKIFGLPIPQIAEKNLATLTMFLPGESWKVETFQSKSRNSAFIGKELQGRPIGIINKTKLFLNA